jgi:arginine:ornithine antiporter/lysine permease
MVGAGIFTLPAALADRVLGAFVAWCIAGLGMLMLARLPDAVAAQASWTPPSTPATSRLRQLPGYLAAFGWWPAAWPAWPA